MFEIGKIYQGIGIKNGLLYEVYPQKEINNGWNAIINIHIPFTYEQKIVRRSKYDVMNELFSEFIETSEGYIRLYGFRSMNISSFPVFREFSRILQLDGINITYVDNLDLVETLYEKSLPSRNQ